MGGAEALFAGLNHLDRFAYVASFSGAVAAFGTKSTTTVRLAPSDVARSWFPGLNETVNARLRLLWVACGTSDPGIEANRQFKSWLKSRGVRFADIETPGAHTFLVFRRNLDTLLPLLFQDAS